MRHPNVRDLERVDADDPATHRVERVPIVLEPDVGLVAERQR